MVTTVANIELEVDIDLSHEQFGRAIPFEAFAELRRSAPLFWYEPDQYWVVSSYELLGEINRNPAVFSSWGGPGGAGSEQQPTTTTGAPRTVLTMDPPQHTTYRRMVSGSFMPRAVNAQADLARDLAKELIKDFVGKGGGDWVTEVATLLPMRVMSALMGMKRDDEKTILRRTNAQLGGTDPEYSAGSPERSAELAAEGNAYVDRLISEHREQPRGDLVDQLIDARVDGLPLSHDELRAWVSMYIGGGAETTRHLIAHGLVCLIEWPDPRRRVVDGHDMSQVIEEMLRYISPVMHHSRWPLERVEIDGKRIEPGQRTTLWMVSANRDETAFDDPDRFDVTRDPNRHDSLGAGGPHFCLGAGLARLEARVLFEEARPYLDRMELAGPFERGQSNFFNILKHCPVLLH